MQDETQRLEQSPPRPPEPPSPSVRPPGGTLLGGTPVGVPAEEALPTPRGLDQLRSEREPPASPAPATAPPEKPPERPAAAPPAYQTEVVGQPRLYATDALAQPRPYDLDHPEPMYLPLALSVGAGFKFGCGFVMAVAISGLLLFLMASVIFFVATLIGIPLPLVTPTQ